MKLSIVATLFQSESHLAEFYQRATASARQLADDDYEIVLVNDGSPDDSLQIAVDLAGKDEHVLVVDLSRNFGHHKAMMTGMEYAKGDLIFLLDSDLEEQPEWLLPFSEKMQEFTCDVVYGVQHTRHGGHFEKITGGAFYSLINYLADTHLPMNPTVARLMSARYVRALLEHKERELFIGGLMHLTGFTQLGHAVEKGNKSATSYTLRRKLSMLVNSITSLSYKPLVLIFYLGLIISLCSFAIVFVIVCQTLFFERPLDGWASTITSIWVSCGLLMCSVGVLGLYISKIFSEVKQRPYTIVREIYRRQTDED